ncbi:hypothetical protein ACX431_000242 [Staphylococcus pseudintermedius]|uniref:hypothetical protein n=1 Tax=Staphylococcus pseudintermedius TaxID=283734 RepID=UPI0019E16EAB|nr:hypothetical protein [Staphylococcus pseudintermedius]EGQ4470978.1 hypothetical protein [Staphylococcus pseudintermedius]EGQ4488669.1 hypothetical protein [Staphylococcus pseudintermedius]ELJ9052806.1 hypothetical protein [Staphylococcus pseudintermedius]ELJ9055142.1 hypothetical protein [Staphylococcus pseudintermedius]
MGANARFKGKQRLDFLIAPTIHILNSKGYKTKFSCSGHLKNKQWRHTYILFEGYNEPNSLPKYFRNIVDLPSEVVNPITPEVFTEQRKRASIYLTQEFIDKNKTNKLLAIIKANVSLLIWSLKLKSKKRNEVW